MSPRKRPIARKESTASTLGSGGTTLVEAKRRIRVFISSTFRDMVEERDTLMTHTWPALRRLCQERYVDLVEVDLRWGITEAQSTRKETLKFCLDEILAYEPGCLSRLPEDSRGVSKRRGFPRRREGNHVSVP